tara:strand:+ start:723 stop:923 length:201 start_codon:yes stop_codon:yes gene_type:complete
MSGDHNQNQTDSGWRKRPPQRKPLTDEAIYAMCDDFHSWSEWDGGEYQRLWLNLCRAIEAAHGIKE